MPDDGAHMRTIENTVVSDDKVSVPETYNYIGVFLTFRCPYSCSFCINHFAQTNPKYTELPGSRWLSFFDKLITGGLPITLQGGEPGSHKDFIEIVKGVSETHDLDILTNLAFDLKAFVSQISPDMLNRRAPYAPIRVSYHPEQFSLDDILAKVKYLQDAGFRVGLYGVLHPDQIAEIRRAALVCTGLGVDFRTKPFLGWHNGVLHGDYAYPGVGSEGSARQWCECAQSELLVAPDGGIHRCHSFLYSGMRPLGHIGDRNLLLTDDFKACNRFGNCNPCDVKVKNNRFQQFGHVSARIKNIRPM